MLNPFPIQFLAPLAFLILRIILGAFMLKKGGDRFGRKKTLGRRLFGALEITIGGMLIAGFFTQIAALATLVVALGALIPRPPMLASYPRSTALLMFAMGAALFITGAGPFAFDLPI